MDNTNNNSAVHLVGLSYNIGNVSEAGPQQNKKQQQDESEAVVMPSAPPEQVQGYEGASFNTGQFIL